MWLKIRMAPMCPYFGTISLAFVGPPTIKVQLLPYNRVRLMRIPILQVPASHSADVLAHKTKLLLCQLGLRQEVDRKGISALEPCKCPSAAGCEVTHKQHPAHPHPPGACLSRYRRSCSQDQTSGMLSQL